MAWQIDAAVAVVPAGSRQDCDAYCKQSHKPSCFCLKYAGWHAQHVHTCMICSSLPVVTLKQYRTLSSPKAYAHSPRGEIAIERKSADVRNTLDYTL